MADKKETINYEGNAGHAATLGEWAESDAGKEFVKGESDRQKSEKDAAEAQKPVDDDKVEPVKAAAKPVAKEAKAEPKAEPKADPKK